MSGMGMDWIVEIGLGVVGVVYVSSEVKLGRVGSCGGMMSDTLTTKSFEEEQKRPFADGSYNDINAHAQSKKTRRQNGTHHSHPNTINIEESIIISCDEAWGR